MNIITTKIKDLYIIESKLFSDNRGWFLESYNYDIFKNHGIDITFVQDNHSFSVRKGVLRGLHFQRYPYSQTKLVRCTKGKIWDVAVDLRKSSATYLEWLGIELSAENHKMLLIPKGFAHGFITLEENSEVQYKVDNFYDKNSDGVIRFDDSDVDIKWPLKNLVLSEKDNHAPFLKDLDVIFE
jgi:dTDP-4-dehydrorhamnose 3,5-epimerase